METETYKYLRFVQFEDLTQWYVKYYLNASSIGSKYPQIHLHKLIFPQKNIVRKALYDEKTPIVEKIVFKTGQIVFRKENKTGMDLYTLKNNDLLISNINFHQGATALNTYGNIVATTHYQPYQIEHNLIDKNYLLMVLRSPVFLNIVAGTKADGIKNESGYKFIGSFTIPLPSLPEQEAIVAAYNAKIAQAAALESQATETEAEIERYLLEELGVENTTTQTTLAANDEYKFLRFVEFEEVERWDIWTNQILSKSSKYETTTFSKIVKNKPKYGAAFSSTPNFNGYRYVRITDINEDGSLNDEIVSATQHDEQYILKQNDFLIARSGNTVGKTFLYEERIGKAIYAGYLIKFEFDETMINPHYLLYYTKCSLYKNWVNSNMRISGQPNINSQQYLASPVTLPPLPVQNAIVEHINTLKEQIKTFKAQAAALRTQALVDFEKEIFE